MYDAANDVLCQITLGIIPGYNHNNYGFPKVEDFCFELKERLETICDHLNYYIPLLAYPAVTVYKTEWGMP